MLGLDCVQHGRVYAQQDYQNILKYATWHGVWKARYVSVCYCYGGCMLPHGSVTWFYMCFFNQLVFSIFPYEVTGGNPLVPCCWTRIRCNDHDRYVNIAEVKVLYLSCWLDGCIADSSYACVAGGKAAWLLLRRCTFIAGRIAVRLLVLYLCCWQDGSKVSSYTCAAGRITVWLVVLFLYSWQNGCTAANAVPVLLEGWLSGCQRFTCAAGRTALWLIVLYLY